MIKSMTAYSKMMVTTEFGNFLIEISSHNKKNLDFSVSLPKGFPLIEVKFRKAISNVVSRGHISLRITKSSATEKETFLPNVDSFKKFNDSLNQFMTKVGLEQSPSLEYLLASYELSSNQGFDEKLEEVLFSSLGTLLEDLNKMKESEGKSLQLAFEEYVSEIKALINDIEKKSVGLPQVYEQKLKERLEKFEVDFSQDLEKLHREAALIADKSDITEEIVRINSHLDQFVEILKAPAAPKGKELDFLALELSREINTILAKSSTLEITQSGLKVKTEIEKIREQVQNIE